MTHRLYRPTGEALLRAGGLISLAWACFAAQQGAEMVIKALRELETSRSPCASMPLTETVRVR